MKLYLIGAAGVLASALAVVGVKAEHKREGEALYNQAIVGYQMEVNLAQRQYADAKAIIDAKRDAALKDAAADRDTLLARVKSEYPESLPVTKVSK